MTPELMVCVTRDIVAEQVVGQPLVFLAEAPAIRSFGDMLFDPQFGLSKHVGDYELVHIGNMQPASGKLSALAKPRVIASGERILAQMKAQMERKE